MPPHTQNCSYHQQHWYNKVIFVKNVGLSQDWNNLSWLKVLLGSWSQVYK